MVRTASAVWNGGLKDGKGVVSTQTGVLKESPYNFSGRFESGTGTNPEELIAAAHASCFSMALSAVLGEHNLKAESIETKAAVTVVPVEGGFGISKIHLDTTVKIPGADDATFQKAAAGAKAGCPISKLFANNAEITLDAKLVS
jgi:osmotically inducible protein OsmC